MDSRPLAATFVAVTGFTVSGNQTVQFLFSKSSAHLFDVSAVKTVMGRERTVSLMCYLSFPVNALDILP